MVVIMSEQALKRESNQPFLSPGSSDFLNLESTLEELPLYDFAVEISCLGEEIARILQNEPSLPGVTLHERNNFVGMISRQKFLEYLLLPQGQELFLSQPLEVLYSYARPDNLILPINTPILTAARRAMRRSPQEQLEPIVVQIEPSETRILDFRQLNLASWQIRGVETQVRYERSQVKMLQSEKMASLGRLVDGIAHEILDPVSFIWGNISHINEYSESLLQLISVYEALLPESSQRIEEIKADIEFDFLEEDLPQAVESITTGAKRLKELASSLQNFCHIDDVYAKPADLHKCLDGIILLLQSRLHDEIEIVKNYCPLPPITCYIGQLSQVFMNILSNAIDALLNQAVAQRIAEEFNHQPLISPPSKPRITITTQVYAPFSHLKSLQERYVSITIADNGSGISEQMQQQIIESFSIDKRADKETSLGMSYEIVTAKHGGKFNFQSQLGKGTEFEIVLPLV